MQYDEIRSEIVLKIKNLSIEKAKRQRIDRIFHIQSPHSHAGIGRTKVKYNPRKKFKCTDQQKEGGFLETITTMVTAAKKDYST